MAAGDNMSYLVKKVKFHTRDIKIEEEELEELILQVIDDIANDTKIFKKILGFSVHEEVKVYDFNALTNMSETVEEELSTVSVMPITPDQIEDFFDTLTLPNPEIDKDLFIEGDGKSTFLAVMDIFDNTGMEVTNKFKYHGTSEYLCEDEEWRREHDLEQFAYTAAVIPHIDEMLPDTLRIITTAVVQGAKYYNSDTLEGQVDAQVANIYYQRYWQKRQELINRYPTQVFSAGLNKQWRW